MELIDFFHQSLGVNLRSLLLAHEFSIANYQTQDFSGSLVLTICRFVLKN